MGVERVDYLTDIDYWEALRNEEYQNLVEEEKSQREIEENYRQLEEQWNKEAEEERREDEKMARWGDDYYPEEKSKPLENDEEYDDLPF